MAWSVRKALENRTDLFYFVLLANDQKTMDELDHYAFCTETELSIFHGATHLDRVWSPSKTLKSLDHLERCGGKSFSLVKINYDLRLNMLPSEAWRVYGTLELLAKKSRLKRDQDHTTDETNLKKLYGVFYSAPDFQNLKLGFTPQEYKNGR